MAKVKITVKSGDQAMRLASFQHCFFCNSPLPDWLIARGRPRAYCNDRCKEAARRERMRNKRDYDLPTRWGQRIRITCLRCKTRFTYRFSGRFRVYCCKSCKSWRRETQSFGLVNRNSPCLSVEPIRSWNQNFACIESIAVTPEWLVV